MGRMGISELNTNRKQYLRKYRFEFFFLPGSPSGFVHTTNTGAVIHMASRPKLTFDQRVMRGTAESIPYHGRGTWENIDITFLDVTGDSRVYEWLCKHHNPETGAFGYHSEVLCNVNIRLVNGIGQLAQSWYLYDVWAAVFDYQELEYASTDVASIQVSLAYTRAIMQRGVTSAGGKASG